MRGKEKHYPDFVTSIRIPYKMYSELEKKLQEGDYDSISEVFRSYCQLGLWVDKIKNDVKDAETLKKSIEHLDQLRKNELVAEWMQCLDKKQLDAFLDIGNLIKAGKWQPTKLISYDTSENNLAQ